MQAFRFLGCWFIIHPKKTAVYKIITDEIAEAIKCLRKAKITEKQAAYIINHVILTRVEYRIQSAILSEATADKYTRKYISIVKQKAGLAKSVPNSTVLHYNIYSFRSIQNIQTQYHVALLVKQLNRTDFNSSSLALRLQQIQNAAATNRSILAHSNYWLPNKERETV